jgi:hypothetical protein
MDNPRSPEEKANAWSKLTARMKRERRLGLQLAQAKIRQFNRRSEMKGSGWVN